MFQHNNVNKSCSLYTLVFVCVLICSDVCLSADGDSAAPVSSSVVLFGDEAPTGEIAVKLLGDAEYKITKKEVEVENIATLEAYKRLKDAHYDKYTKEYKEQIAKMMQESRNGGRQNQQNRQNQQGQIKRTVPPFLLNKPSPRKLHFYGGFKDEAAAGSQKTLYEEREAARQSKLTEQADKMKSGSNDSGTGGVSSKVGEGSFKMAKPDIYGKKNERAACPKELLDQFAKEVEKVKQEMAGVVTDEKGGQGAARKARRLGDPVTKDLKAAESISGGKGSAKSVKRLGGN